MKRWHMERRVMMRNKRVSDKYRPGLCLGHFRKRHALDCGNTQCYICHSDKFPKRTFTKQEDISDLDYREQLRDL